MQIAAFTRYGRQAASTRQRLLQYIPALNAAGIDVAFEPLLDDEYIRSLAAGGAFSRLDVASSYLRRLRGLLSRPSADIIWIYAELFPYLPGWFERLALSRSRAIVYDFDDAFFHNYDASPNPLVRTLLGRKLEPLLRRASACCCGNAYLEDYASRFCERTMVVPTVVDTAHYTPRIMPSDPSRPVVIGWIGSPTTWRYMRPMLPLLAELVRERGVKVRVVGAGPKAEQDRFPGLELLDWAENREVADVQGMDIGIMPVPDEIWALGKSGYKLIQYMACGLPVVASPVGVNRDIVAHGASGFLATTPAEWRSSLSLLLDDADLRLRMGLAGRKHAEEDYSLAVHAPRLAGLLRSVARPGGDRQGRQGAMEA
ncbi:MAG: glycosyltransferase family 4 protein [Pseudomonadota bacterium]|jgi:glycosyltransferase involved in cell wall biosynthesis|nr:glycosyltransferase family 4 protein [Pseudomonadota bacterium]